MVPEDCREFFLWEPMEKAKPWPRWKKPSPINLRGAQAEIMKLDVASRRAIDIYVNEGLVEEDAVIDFSRRGHMSTILETALGTAQTDEEVDAVIAAGRTYLRNWHLGREGFRSRGEHEVACNVKTAEKLSRESIFFPEGGVDDGAEGEEGGEGAGAVVARVVGDVVGEAVEEGTDAGGAEGGGASQDRGTTLSAAGACPPQRTRVER
eukprot:3939599-Rhodomonas_salina.3